MDRSAAEDQHSAPTDTSTEAPRWPIDRTCPFAPSRQYDAMREQGISRVTMADGSETWLITDHALAREALASSHTSSFRAAPGYPQFTPAVSKVAKQQKGSIITMDPPEHSRYRRMVTDEFTVKRVHAMRPGIQRIVDEVVTDFAAGPRPADLVAEVALPIPSLVICELLGVPADDRKQFQGWTGKVLNRNTPVDEVVATIQLLREYMSELVSQKEREPSDDLLGRQIAKYRAQGGVEHESLTGLGMVLLVAGHETTANMIALSSQRIMSEPGLRGRVLAEPERTPALVEEMLRYFAIVDGPTSRAVVEDMQIGGVTVRAGEGFIVSIGAVNHDPAVFEAPDRIDTERGSRRHLAFGYGIHQCLGQNLARLELEIALNTLFTRLPGLELAVDTAFLPVKNDAAIFGFHEMPVTW